MAEPRKPRRLVLRPLGRKTPRMGVYFEPDGICFQLGMIVQSFGLHQIRRLHDALGRWIKWREYRDGK